MLARQTASQVCNGLQAIQGPGTLILVPKPSFRASYLLGMLRSSC